MMVMLASWGRVQTSEISEEPVWRLGSMGWRASCATVRLSEKAKWSNSCHSDPAADYKS